MTVSEQIEIDPRVCNGKPVIAGTRIPVSAVLDMLSAGDNMADIQRKYPELTQRSIAAALNYCHSVIDHSDVESVAV